MSDKNDELTSTEEGWCLGNYAPRASACKICQIVDKCKKMTRELRKETKKKEEEDG